MSILSKSAKKTSKTKKTKRPKAPKLSHRKLPDGMSPLTWQRALRQQFGREQNFGIVRAANDFDEREAPLIACFGDYWIKNYSSQNRYLVSIRALLPGDNRCTCADFLSNELGTCKHIEFALAHLLKKRGAKAIFARGYRPSFSELILRNEGTRSVHFRAGSTCPPALLQAATKLFSQALSWQLPVSEFAGLEAFLALAARHDHPLHAHSDALDFIAGQRDLVHRSALLQKQFPRGAADSKLLKLLKVPMYPYQAEGALFAVRVGRVLIGDEMGLGKTVQAIAAVELFARHFGVSKVLVICPTSLKYQWQSEIARFSERSSQVIGGLHTRRQKEYAVDDFYKITNYEKLKPDLDLIAAWAPDLVIVDEAQRVKNWNTIAAKAIKRINSPYAIVLTGTPLENKLEELISITQFVDQHRLGPTWKLLHEHQIKDEVGRVTGYTGLEKIGQTLAPILIRRRKSEVLLQLPSRTDQNFLVPMTAQQQIHHDENAEIVALIVGRWRKTGYLSDVDQRRLTCALQNMRMSCNSTYLLDHESDHGVKADEMGALMDGLFCNPDAKMVVFSQWTRTQELVIRRLAARGLGYVSFHGGVPAEKRPLLVQQFRDDPNCRVFLSTDAGSTGLNLQHAATVVNMDLPWNPAILEQRIGRVHRMGQTQPVQVINFIAKGTIKEGMLSILAFKRSLASGILDSGGSEISMGGSRLNRFMKDVESVTGKILPSEPLTAAEASAAAGDLDAVADAKPATPQADTSPTASDSKIDVNAELVADRVDATIVDAAAVAMHAAPTAALDPWASLLAFGTELVAALVPGEAGKANAHPWLEQDRTTGKTSLKLPMPGAETTRKLADILTSVAELLRR